jgi:hypothetical protein
VGDGKIEFDAESGPRPAVPDERFLDGGVGVEHLAAGPLVETAVDVAAEIRQHCEPEIFVFEIQRTPADDIPAVCEGVAERIGIVEPPE